MESNEWPDVEHEQHVEHEHEQHGYDELHGGWHGREGWCCGRGFPVVGGVVSGDGEWVGGWSEPHGGVLGRVVVVGHRLGALRPRRSFQFHRLLRSSRDLST